MKERIEKIVLSLKGTLLGFGIQEEDILNAINKNSKIIECHLLNSIDLDTDEKGYFKSKKITQSKLKKMYGHKGVTTMLIDADQLFLQERKLVSKFVYITSEFIYVYNIKDIEKTIKKYKRYNTDIQKIKVGNEYMLKVDVRNSKKHFFLDKIYLMIDFILDTVDIISEILTS